MTEFEEELLAGGHRVLAGFPAAVAGFPGFGIPYLTNLHRVCPGVTPCRARPHRYVGTTSPARNFRNMDDDLKQLRDRTARLFALALRAEEDGRTDDAKELVQLAFEALAHADSIERRMATQQAPDHCEKQH
jgi:hypothetical protein